MMKPRKKEPGFLGNLILALIGLALVGGFLLVFGQKAPPRDISYERLRTDMK